MDHFTQEELKPLRNGIRTFIRLTGFIHDDFQYRWFADEFDAASSLRSVATTFQKTKEMLGKSKYQGQQFDPIRQVREDLAASMLTGHTESTTIANRKRYGPLYHLVIQPAVELFSKFDHQTILNIVDECVAQFITMVEQCDDYGSLDDALVAQAIARMTIQRHEADAAIARSTRRKANRKKKKDEIEQIVAEVKVEAEAEEEIA